MTTLAYEPVTQLDPRFRYYRPRILVWSIVGYAMFYFVRKNLSIAMPVMAEQLHITKTDLGLFLTLHGLIYGVSKFINGFIGDRVNAPIFMAIGLVGSAIVNFFFGLGSAVVWFGIFWMINGWFQGIGFPPCARLLTHWFSPKELSMKMSIWNTSHSIGAGCIVILCGFLVDHFHNWRLCFFVPAALAIITSFCLLIFLKDTPKSVGLPEVPGTEEVVPEDADDPHFGTTLRRRVFGNPYIWLFSLANFFVYTIRYGVFDWGPTFLKEAKGMSLGNAGWMVALFEASGVVGMLAAGWITDRVFNGRGARTSVFCMIFAGIALLLFRSIPPGKMFLTTLAMMAAGFFIYGPQALVGIAVANLATKRAAATAVGLTGVFGYASTTLSGWGLGWLVQHYGWDRAFLGLLVVTAIGLVLFLLAWSAPRDGYGEPSS
jgi:OPA family glycerol-3-phosphate transporter-like MFS transporter/OPA family sugar phosphate sensor protein UhpC-like MFS transporter